MAMVKQLINFTEMSVIVMMGCTQGIRSRRTFIMMAWWDKENQIPKIMVESGLSTQGILI